MPPGSTRVKVQRAPTSTVAPVRFPVLFPRGSQEDSGAVARRVERSETRCATAADGPNAVIFPSRFAGSNHYAPPGRAKLSSDRVAHKCHDRDGGSGCLEVLDHMVRACED